MRRVLLGLVLTGMMVLGGGCAGVGTSVTEPAAVGPVSINTKRPRSQPQTILTRPLRPDSSGKDLGAISVLGISKLNAKWGDYGKYMMRLAEPVQIHWDTILLNGRTVPPAGTLVVVCFVLDAQGEIARVVSVETNSSQRGAQACVAAIVDRAPFDPWTPEMIAALGTEQELTFTFHYQ